jgi:sugar/nucleoside kinase (ribokinase family)
VRIATFGDVLLDVIVRLEEPLAPGGDVRAATRAGAGGQAANVAAWAAELGAEARCIAKRGDDPAGELVARELAAHGVELLGPAASGSTGVVVSVVETGDRALASDRGVATTFAPEELDAAWLACDVLHISGYALVRKPICGTALLAARFAREAGAQISVDVAAWTEIRSFGPVRFRELLDELAPDVLFATEAEWELLGGAYLTAPTGVLKRGARGCSVFSADSKLDFAALEVDVVDPTGAGDALAAGFLVSLDGVGSLEEAARRGIEAAARCVAKVGSLP